METTIQPLPPLTLPAREEIRGPEGFRPPQPRRMEQFGGSEVNGSAFSVPAKGGGFGGLKNPEGAFNVPLPIPPHLESTRSFGEMPLPMHFGIANDPKFLPPLHHQGPGGFQKPLPAMTLSPLNQSGAENLTNPPLKVRIKMPPVVALPDLRAPEEDPDIVIIEPTPKSNPVHKTALQRVLEETNNVPETKELLPILLHRVPESKTHAMKFKTTCDAFVTSQPLPEDPSFQNTVVRNREAIRENETAASRGPSVLLDALRLPPSTPSTIHRLPLTLRSTDANNNNKKGHQKLLYKEMRYLRTSITQLQQKVQIQSISHIKEKEAWEESDKQKSLAIEVALNKISKLEADNKALQNFNKELKQKIENQKSDEASLKRKSINDVADSLLKKKRETKSPEEKEEAEVIKTFLASQTNPFKNDKSSETVTSLKDIPPVFPLILPNLILVPEGPIPGYSEKHLKKLHAAQKRCFYAPAYKYPNIAKKYLFWYNRILGLPQVCEKAPNVHEIRMQLLEESVVLLEQWPSTRIDSEARMMKALIDEEYEEQLRKGWCMHNFLKELEAKRRFKRHQRELMGEPAEEHPPALTGDMVIGKVGFEGVTWSPRPDCPYEYKGPNPLPLRNRIDQEDMSMDFSNQPAPQEQGTPEVLRTHSQEEIQEHYRMLGIPMEQKIARTDKNGSSGTDASESGAQTRQGPIGSGSEDLFVTMGDFFENVQTDFGGHNMESMDKVTPMEMDFGSAQGTGNPSTSEPVRGAPIYGGPPQSASARKPAPLNLGGPMRYDLYEPRSSGSKRGGPTTYGQFREGQPAPTPPIHTPASMDIGRPMSAQSGSTFVRLTATPIRDPIQPSGPTTGALSVVSISCTSGPDGAGASQDPEPARSHLENMILQLERGYRERLHKKDLEIGILRTSNNFLHKALKEKNDHCAQFHSSMTTISTPGSSGTNSPMVSAKPTMSFENALAIFQEWMKNTKPQIERNMGIDFKKYVFNPYGSQDIPQSVLVVSTGAHLYRQANEFESLSVEQQTKWNACAQLLTKYQWELSGLGLIQPMTVEQKTQKGSEKRMGRKRGGSSGEAAFELLHLASQSPALFKKSRITVCPNLHI
ncbi:hypothetical protein L5515_015459 [Caenorhabditis briggsae]|uniref:Uncharacterized protein n=1 Tax=Caenorhabditis briggsae TaxID=6238 RepID=A0AAE9J865_CAEBR|nr:hypothetical protein L5515_015459 [Caenorhabditis briggsae]